MRLRARVHIVHGPVRQQRVVHLRQQQLRLVRAFVLDRGELHGRHMFEDRTVENPSVLQLVKIIDLRLEDLRR